MAARVPGRWVFEIFHRLEYFRSPELFRPGLLWPRHGGSIRDQRWHLDDWISRVLGTWMLTSIATIPISTILRFAGRCQGVVFISPSHQEVDIRCRPAPVTHRTQFARRCGAERRRLPMCLHVDAPGFRVDWTPHLPMEFWGCCCCGLGLFPPRRPLPQAPLPHLTPPPYPPLRPGNANPSYLAKPG